MYMKHVTNILHMITHEYVIVFIDIWTVDSLSIVLTWICKGFN